MPLRNHPGPSSPNKDAGKAILTLPAPERSGGRVKHRMSVPGQVLRQEVRCRTLDPKSLVIHEAVNIMRHMNTLAHISPDASIR